jgi:hypothetical protein
MKNSPRSLIHKDVDSHDSDSKRGNK